MSIPAGSQFNYVLSQVRLVDDYKAQIPLDQMNEIAEIHISSPLELDKAKIRSIVDLALETNNYEKHYDNYQSNEVSELKDHLKDLTKFGVSFDILSTDVVGRVLTSKECLNKMQGK